MSPARRVEERARVLLVAPHHPPEAGAGAARLGGLSRELRRLGHDVRVVAPEATYMTPRAAAEPGPPAGASGAGPEPHVARVRVARRGHGATANAAHQVRLLAALRSGSRAVLGGFGADVVLVSVPPPLAGLAAIGLRDRRGRELPLVVDVRDLWPDVLIEAGALSEAGPAAAALRLVERRLLEAASLVTSVTETKVRRLAARSAVSVELVPNGVDPDWESDEPSYLGGEGEGFEVLHAGNVGRAQDVGLLVEAIRILRREPGGPRVRATVVGEGEDLERVRRLASGLGEHVGFLPVEDREAVRRRLARCGCSFVSLRTERLVDAVPSKLLEALARGVPVVLSAAGESARLLERSGGGLVVRPGDARGLAAALRRLAGLSPAERRALGARGRAWVLEGHRRADAAAKLSDLLDRVARAHAP